MLPHQVESYQWKWNHLHHQLSLRAGSFYVLGEEAQDYPSYERVVLDLQVDLLTLYQKQHPGVEYRDG